MTKPNKTRSGGDKTNIRFENPYLILVEGADDQAIISALITSERLEDFQVHDINGKSNIPKGIKSISRQDDFIANVRAFGVMQDADDHPDDAWNSCTNALGRSGLPVPKSPVMIASPDPENPDHEGRPSTAVLIVPSLDDNGAIEELCLQSFDKARMQCVENYLKCLAENGPEDKRRGKGLVQAYLGGLKEPRRDLVIAAAKGEIELDHSCFDKPREFLKNLASVPR